MNTTPYDSIIVGAGHNGLVTAAYLARAGLKVLVLERRPMVGGACVTEEIFPGCHISTCSFVVHLLQDKVVKDLDLYRHGYEVRQVDPIHLCPMEGTDYTVLWEDIDRTCAEFGRRDPGDAVGYRRWYDFWTRAGGLFNRYYLSEPPTLAELREQVRGTEDEALLDRLLNGTLIDLLNEFFVTEQAKATLVHTYDLKHLDEPGVLFSNAVYKADLHVDYANQGLVTGGMGTLTAAMARAAEEFGAHIRCGAEVREILVEDGRAQGVVLTDGQVIRSRMVVSNADAKRTFLKLLRPEHVAPETLEGIRNLHSDSGNFKFHAIVNELPDFSRYLGAGFDPTWIAHVRICPSLDYYRKSVADCEAGRPSRSPLINVQIPTVYDKTLAPPGTHIVSMWVRYQPIHPKGTTWDALREGEGQFLIDTLTGYAPNFRRSLLDWVLYTPADIESRTYITDGNIHHISHIPGQLLGDRLFKGGGHRTPLAGLYMCGSSTHPGGEVTGAPGHNAAHAILADEGRLPAATGEHRATSR